MCFGFRLLFSIAGLAYAQSSTAAELIGLQNIPLQPEERIWTFDIKLAEGRILALNKTPIGWKITTESYGEAGDYKDGGGEIEGGADFFHDALSSADLSFLGGFILIGDSVIHHARAVLTGSVTIGGLNGTRTLRLRPENFIRKEVKEGRKTTDRSQRPPSRGGAS